MLSYKGYVGRVEFDNVAEIFNGVIIGIREVITFHGKSVAEIRMAMEESLEDYFALCKKQRKEPEKPFSGKLVLRLDSELHRKIACAALREGKSLNKWIIEVLDGNDRVITPAPAEKKSNSRKKH